jgi:hypothetical protein
MRAHNIIIMADFERQSRDRTQKAAENSRLLQRSNFKDAAPQEIPERKSIFSLDWLKRRLVSPAN